MGAHARAAEQLSEELDGVIKALKRRIEACRRTRRQSRQGRGVPILYFYPTIFNGFPPIEFEGGFEVPYFDQPGDQVPGAPRR